MIKIYLASASPRRREILELLKLDFTVLTADANEDLPQGTAPESAGEILAARKAAALMEKLKAEGRFDSETVIIAADTLVYCGGVRLGKPENEADAFEMLMSLSGKEHEVCTGTCVICGERSISHAEVSRVRMRAFTAAEALAYVGTNEPLDKAGAYGIQGIGSVLVDSIDGDFFSVMGMSPTTVYRLFKALGVSYFELIKEK